MSRYRYCGDSQQGKSHEVKGTVCQDAYCSRERNGLFVTAVADGLGSSKHSDVASKMAAYGVVDYCIANISGKCSESSILTAIRNAFATVCQSIKDYANDCMDDYDTTLTVAVLIGGVVYFGHAGDSAIISLRSDGIFEQVTEQQLGDGIGKDRPVYPLAAESRWIFSKYDHRVKALFLMTDGVLNKIAPPLLEDQEYRLDHAYLYYLYDNLCKSSDLDRWISDEVGKILPQETNFDDKTLTAVMVKYIKLKPQPLSYYRFPTEQLWGELIGRYKRELYPEKDQTPSPPVTPSDT